VARRIHSASGTTAIAADRNTQMGETGTQ